MNTKILTASLFLATAGTVAIFPLLESDASNAGATIVQELEPKIEVVFALDTTSSMSGMINAAKEKIWSIATTLGDAQQTPEIRMGLVAFRDRGDDYVTRVIDLTSDIDSVYAELMRFQAVGGGDGPESVNAALDDSINAISWSQDPAVYRTVFLVGDSPPHMDYAGERRYPAILADARERGITVNAVQCGEAEHTRQVWNEIARLGGGSYLHVGQSGNAIAIDTPFDAEIAELAAALDATRLSYGNEEERARMEAKVHELDAALAAAPQAARARRGVFIAGETGRTSLFADGDLVADLEAGTVDLEELLTSGERLPEPLRGESVEALQRRVVALSENRAELRQRIGALAAERESYLEAKLELDPAAESSLDLQLYDVIREQAGQLGIVYDQGPKL